MSRRRAIYAVLSLGTILLGLLVHLRGNMLAPAVRDAAGDALWAMMITWWAGALVPAARPTSRGAAAYAISVGVEVSQLYHSAALDVIRGTTLGHLVLGSDFNPRDLAVYAVGVVTAVLLDVLFVARRHRSLRSRCREATAKETVARR